MRGILWSKGGLLTRRDFSNSLTDSPVIRAATSAFEYDGETHVILILPTTNNLHGVSA